MNAYASERMLVNLLEGKSERRSRLAVLRGGSVAARIYNVARQPKPQEKKGWMAEWSKALS